MKRELFNKMIFGVFFLLFSIQADTNLLEDVPPVFISVHHLKLTGSNNCGEENDIKKCWSSSATYEYRFKGVKVQVLGTNLT